MQSCGAKRSNVAKGKNGTRNVYAVLYAPVGSERPEGAESHRRNIRSVGHWTFILCSPLTIFQLFLFPIALH